MNNPFKDVIVIDTTNKYQEALNKLKNMGDKDLYNERHLDWLNTLQGLVDKETPKKPSYLNYGGYKIGNHHCPTCDSIINKQYNYCPECGQKLNWEVKDER